ncbi:GNAT family N-acetyltransferase [bacterium]|nr:GNAT family N-acetyltransferase [bacterium]MBU1650753.1 GNAT family N-acetyltransferase [bacterium]
MGASDRNPQFYCPLRDRYINVGEADILVVSTEAKEDHAKPEEAIAESNITLKRAYEQDMDDVREVVEYFWDETEFYCFDQTFKVEECTNILAYAEDDLAGLLSYKRNDQTLHIVVLNVYPEHQGQGIARKLIREAIEIADKNRCETVKVATTNDDIPAICVYQKMGFRLSEILPGAVAKHHGEELPGFAGIPVLDEIRLERPV